MGSDGAFDLHDSPSDNASPETFKTWVTAIRMDSTMVPSLARIWMSAFVVAPCPIHLAKL